MNRTVHQKVTYGSSISLLQYGFTPKNKRNGGTSLKTLTIETEKEKDAIKLQVVCCSGESSKKFKKVN